MKSLSKTIMIGMIMVLFTVGASANNPNFHIYLCIGQSNMEGNAPVVDRPSECAGAF